MASEIKTLISKLSRFKLSRIVVEATEGYEPTLAQAMAEAELPAIVIQPTNVRQFAKAQGILAKTDKIDAQLIAQFGAIIKPEIRLIIALSKPESKPLHVHPTVSDTKKFDRAEC